MGKNGQESVLSLAETMPSFASPKERYAPEMVPEEAAPLYHQFSVNKEAYRITKTLVKRVLSSDGEKVDEEYREIPEKLIESLTDLYAVEMILAGRQGLLESPQQRTQYLDELAMHLMQFFDDYCGISREYLKTLDTEDLEHRTRDLMDLDEKDPLDVWQEVWDEVMPNQGMPPVTAGNYVIVRSDRREDHDGITPGILVPVEEIAEESDPDEEVAGAEFLQDEAVGTETGTEEESDRTEYGDPSGKHKF